MVSNNKSKLYNLRKTFAFILAAAVSQIYDDSKLGSSSVNEDGFYYDFKFSCSITQENLICIENKMKELIVSGSNIVGEEREYSNSVEIFGSQPYKLELLNELKKYCLFSFGKFCDISEDADILSINDLDPQAFKLLSLSGAYWKGNSSNDMLTRISGTAFENEILLNQYLQHVDDASLRDHRVLGNQLDLFSSSPEIGQGLVLWHPKGAMIRYLLEKFSQQAHIMNGYDWVYSPHIGRSELWKTSGHLDFYKDSMYSPILIDNDEYYLKPMNCPFHIEIYKSSPKSYRDLPVRYAEFGSVYRYELSGALQGMTRVRGFTQDDAHIFCTPSQIEEEVLRALKFSLYILRSFGLEKFKAYISTKPEHKSIGEQKDWDTATECLKNAVVSAGLPFDIDEGGGAFYGPKIDLKLYDALGREWQCSTIQFDFNLPERFKISYIDSNGVQRAPMMVHRALFGSLERFFAMLIEHYNGEFPLWLAPVQIGIVPIRENHNDYANKLTKLFKCHGLRVKSDTSSDQMRSKIRKMELEKIPIILVIGSMEIEQNGVSVRSRYELNGKAKGDLGFMTTNEFLEFIEPEIKKSEPKYLDE